MANRGLVGPFPGNEHWVVRVLFRGKKVDFHLLEDATNLLNCLGMESPFSSRYSTLGQHVHSLVQCAWHVHCPQKVDIVLCKQ